MNEQRPSNSRVAALRHLHDKLKSGDYDGTDVMAAWIAVEDLACLLERTAVEPRGTGNVDWLGLALELETQAKRVESQTVERAMLAGAHGLRLMGATEPPAERRMREILDDFAVAAWADREPSVTLDSFLAWMRSQLQDFRPTRGATSTKSETVKPVCPECRGGGQVCTGNSGREDDGYAPILERCEACDGSGVAGETTGDRT